MTALSPVYPVQNLINAAAIGFGMGISAVMAINLGGRGQGRRAWHFGRLCAIIEKMTENGVLLMDIRTGFHHAALLARDLEETLSFYSALGCSVVLRWTSSKGDAALMDMGGGNYLEIFAGAHREPERAPRFEHIALASRDVDGDFARALAAGAAEHLPPTDKNLGGVMPIRIAFVTGPNQELIEFFCQR